jgi:hypothetical protein
MKDHGSQQNGTDAKMLWVRHDPPGSPSIHQ